jgi:hypothetical protein
MRIPYFVAVLSLLIVPQVFSDDDGQAPPPAESPRFDFDRDGEVDRPWFPSQGDLRVYRVVPDVAGARSSRTCLAQADPRSPDACDFGRELSRMPPCTRAADCQALDLWSGQVGPPSLRLTRPPAAGTEPEPEDVGDER